MHFSAAMTRHDPASKRGYMRRKESAKQQLRSLPRVALVVPTLEPGEGWRTWLQGFASQTMRPEFSLVIDSSSGDDTVPLAHEFSFAVHRIAQADFRHGATRQLGVRLVSDADLIVFLTQDAVLAHPQALENLLTSFDDPEVGAAYGRQLPRKNASPPEAHARLFNYPPVSAVKSFADQPRLGIKTPFISNSFAAYRRTALESVGGFPEHVIVSEDTFVAAKMILEGWKLAYCAEAQVYHSHDFSLNGEFQRYFNIGAFHANHPWIRNAFGGAEGEAWRYFRSEMNYLLDNGPVLIPSVLFRTLIKFCGYRLGLMRKLMPNSLAGRLGIQSAYRHRVINMN
jgi:rhamnosyltransferase